MTRVLLVNTRHFTGGGDSTYTFNLARLLVSRGHGVAFFAMRDERNLSDPNDDLFVSPVDFRELNRHKNPLAGLRVLSRSLYSYEAQIKFSQILDRFKPDIVHLQNIHAHITPSVIFEAKRRGLPVVWTLHDYRLICPNSHFRIDATGEICEACGTGTYYQAILKHCKKNSVLASTMAAVEAYAHRLMGVREHVDAFLSPSVFLRGKFIDRGFPADKVHHLPLFLPNTIFETDGGFDGNGSNDGYLLFLGKLEPIKGVRTLLKACGKTADIKLILAGRVEEPLASELPNLLPANAQYVGMKSGREIRHLVRNALAIVLPSLWYENQPFSILEAFASAKPVIASDLGGMGELVADRERGLLVPPGDVDLLATAMRWIAAHPAEARSMGRAGLRYARLHHGAERHYAQLMQTYVAVRQG